MRNVLHVPTITKNLESNEQIVDQGIQVRFTHHGFFIEEDGKIIAQGCQEGRMFILDTNDVGIAIFAKGKKVKSDIDLWQKQCDHVNFSQRQEMRSKNIVLRLPNFSGQKGQVCEACQLRKKHRHSFPKERNRAVTRSI